MRWGNIQILWFIFALIPVVIFFIYDFKKRKSQFQKFSNPSVWSRIIPEVNWNSSLRKGLLISGGLFFLVLALARPQWGKKEENFKVNGLDIMLVLDVSNSMEVEDVIPTRLKLAKKMIRHFLDSLSGDRIGIVAFAGSAYLASPLTTDLGFVSETLETVVPELVVGQGSDIGAGLKIAAQSLERAAEDLEGVTQQEASRVVLLITDGEDHEQTTEEALKKLKEVGAQLVIVNVGTEKGGPVPVRDSKGNLVTFKKDRRGQPVISQASPQSLMKLSEKAQGKFFNLESAEKLSEELLIELGSFSRGEYAERKITIFEERFQWPLFLAVLFFVLELFVSSKKLIAKTSVGVLFFLMGQTGFTQTKDLEMYLRNEQGIRALQDGNLDQAKEKFGAAQAHDPKQPELKYNQGIVEFESGDVDSAVKNFQESIQKSKTEKKLQLEAQSQFNLGKAFSQKNEYESAIKSYLESIDLAKKLNDLRLESAARKNIELLQKQKQEQKKNQANEKNQPDPQDGKHDQKAPDDPGSGKQPTPQYGETTQEQRKKSFRSQNLSKEAADRVMAELSDREKELQARLKKGKTPPVSGKDW